MRAFCGWVSWTGEFGGEDAIVRAMLARDRPDQDVQISKGSGWCLALANGVGPGASAEETGFSMLWTGTPRSTSISAPGIAPGIAAWCKDALGTKAKPERELAGHFAFVAVEAASRRAVLAVDRFSVHPVYYAQVGGGMVFGSSPRVVAAHPAVSDELSSQAIHDFMYATVIPAPQTIYKQVRALRSGHALRFADGKVNEFVHWQPQFVDDAPSKVGTDAERRVIDCLTEAVRTSLPQQGQGGCFLSGGIDSSSILGCLSGLSKQPAQAFSIGFAVDGYDELSYARVAAQHFGAEINEYYVTPADIVELIPRVAKAFGQPFGNSSVIPTFHCATMAREHGMNYLLAGDGGDEIFGGNERYGRDWIFSRYQLLPSPLRSVLQSWAAHDAPLLGTLPIFRKAVSYVRHASIALPQRLDVFNYLKVLGVERIFERDFLAEIDPLHVLKSRAEIFSAARSENDVNCMMALDFAITLADNDLQKVSVMCDQAGMHVEYPFLQDEMVDFSLSLPAEDKVKRTQLRHFFRTAMAGFLPGEILSKTKHGFGLPFGTWAMEDSSLRNCVFDILGVAGGRGIVAPEFVRELTDSLLERQPNYYGPLVWQIVSLEAWLHENS